MNKFQLFYYNFITNSENLKYKIVNFKIKEFKYKKVNYLVLDDLVLFVFLLKEIKNDHNNNNEMINIHKHILYFLKNYPLKYIDNIETNTHKVLNFETIIHEKITYKIIKNDKHFGICINIENNLNYYLCLLSYNCNFANINFTKLVDYKNFHEIMKNIPIKNINKSTSWLYKFFNKKNQLKQNSREYRRSRNNTLSSTNINLSYANINLNDSYIDSFNKFIYNIDDINNINNIDDAIEDENNYLIEYYFNGKKNSFSIINTDKSFSF